MGNVCLLVTVPVFESLESDWTLPLSFPVGVSIPLALYSANTQLHKEMT